ncbi:Uncharacterized protein BP5553_01667 [Venustampulla echinocandica]|uniref:Uncharacterized protein n=1 Tax=Venustampulla echinocandica TaxID=2656787 RepID=A0A370U1P4_9HELO|nr:Uncharacterized protein BP5553_01667 [Venustampulla echinocandica]RDL41688.1 Uncharacterized protein BP5553_01667 [Venustampulla echinocandica]
MHFTPFSTGKLALLALSSSILAQPTVEKRSLIIDLDLAKSFGAVAGTSLNNTGATSITGDCGTCPGSTITGFPPGKCSGTSSANDTPGCNAEATCITAYNNARAQQPTSALGNADLGGLTFAPGVYTFPGQDAKLTGNVTIDGKSDPKGQWIFLINNTFTAAANSRVVTINGAQACHIYFVAAEAATVGEASVMQGNILAYNTITVSNAASNQGIFCALNGTLTLNNNSITAQPNCTS